MALSTLHELTSDGVSLVIDTSRGTPEIVHWGAPLGEASDLLAATLDGVPQSGLDELYAAGFWREHSRGFLGRPAIQGHRAGLDWTPRFEIADVEHGPNIVAMTSIDDNARLVARVRFELTQAGVLLVSASLTNAGTDIYELAEFTTWMPVPDHAVESIDYSGRWLKERQPQRRAIQDGCWLREEREGRTGHGATIVQLAMTAGADYQHGSVWALGLQWSGNSRYAIERLATGYTAMGAGELSLPGEIRLEPGETYDAPTVAAVYSARGIDGVSDRYFRWIRSRENHPATPRPLTLNVWEAVYFDHDLDRLSALVDAAATVGVERFVLDDGWFAARRGDFAGLGDWVVSESVWPEGLDPLIAKVKAAGMGFGLWFEGEMVNADSDLYRAHPEWILHTSGRVPAEARHQQVLDITHEGAFAHVLGQVDALLNRYDISYIKWDHNRPLIEASHYGHAAVRRQTLAIYRLFDELKRRHPGLEIESCASGGGRIDLGMIDHADRFWTSDCNDALERHYIQRYTQVAIPPELLGSHIGPTRSHTTGRVHNLSFRANTALFGHAGIEWDLTTVAPDELAHLSSWAAYYKAKRGLLHSGRVVRSPAPDDSAFLHGVIALDASEALVSYVQLDTARSIKPARFRIPGLDADALYQVRVVEPAGPAVAVQLRQPEWMTGVTITGAQLGELGLRPPTLHPENAILIELERV